MTLQTIHDISFIVLPVCILFIVASYYINKKSKFLIAIMVLAVVLSVGSFITLVETNKKIAELELTTAIEEDWPFLINGIEVEPENVYLDGYQIKYDKESKKVHLFPKRWNAW